jgi:hypothetical protein
MRRCIEPSLGERTSMLRAPLLMNAEPSGLKASAVIGAASALNQQTNNARTAARGANPKSLAPPRGSSSSFVLDAPGPFENENEDEDEQ